MNAMRLRTLMTNLPGMAAVVNSFNSPQVQLAVFEALMQAMNEKMELEGLGGAPAPVPSRAAIAPPRGLDQELTHDLIDGDSIHSVRV